MERHPTDFTELFFGLAFLAAGGGFLVRQTTDQAVDPAWIYVLVSLKDGEPVLRAYRIRDGRIAETQVVLERR